MRRGKGRYKMNNFNDQRWDEPENIPDELAELVLNCPFCSSKRVRVRLGSPMTDGNYLLALVCKSCGGRWFTEITAGDEPDDRPMVGIVP